MIAQTEFTHKFIPYNRVPSSCNVKIRYKDGIHFILFENTGNGVSVTNASEQLASEIVNMMNYHPGECRFFETYSEYDDSTFDEISYTWTIDGGWKASDPFWVSAEKIKELFIN